MVTVSKLQELVNWEEGKVSPSILFDKEIYQQEQERVFGRSWMVVGHEDMVRKPGDYVTNYMGEVPVIMLKDQDNKVRVMINRCVHRGNQVCLYDRGNVNSFTCSYHGWAYGLDGSLIGIPMEQQIFHGEFNREGMGLDEVRTENFHGMIFGCFDKEAPALEDWLGEDGAWWLQHFILADHIGGLENLPGWHRYATPGNWKLLAENFTGDNYHVRVATHASWFEVVREFGQKGRLPPKMMGPNTAGGGRRFEGSAGYRTGTPMGIGGVFMEDFFEPDLESVRPFGDQAVKWLQDRRQAFLEVLKDREERPYSFGHGLIFPHTGLMGFSSAMTGRHFLQFHPRGPIAHEQWQWTMLEKEAPAIVKEIAAERVYQGQHMAGTIAPDDVENMERITEALRSPITWERPNAYPLQLGHEVDGPRDGVINLGPGPSEVNQREFYRHWLELMDKEA